MFLDYDITNFMNWWMNQFISIASNVFSLLDSFKFNGISLLTYLITIGVLTVLIVIVLPNIEWNHSAPRDINEKSTQNLSDKLGL